MSSHFNLDADAKFFSDLRCFGLKTLFHGIKCFLIRRAEIDGENDLTRQDIA
ncbi:hypothetical protein D3C79_1118880 [compost metagenome]